MTTPASSPHSRLDAAPVAVIGGGWAGCAAAVTLAQAGHRVTLFEQGKVLGGRARRLEHRGLVLDNGQHLLIGAYRQTLALMSAVHGAGDVAALFHRLPLMLQPFASGDPKAVALRARRAPAPLHLAAGILAARGLDWRERLGLMNSYRRLAATGFRCPPEQSVAECFAATPQRAMGAVWAPLCIAALNTAPDQASAQVFANVLRAAFSAPAANSDFLIPATDLSALFPEAAARFVTTRGGTVHLGTRARPIVAASEGVRIEGAPGGERFAAAIIAVAPHQLAATLGGTAAAKPSIERAIAQVGAFGHESITTIYLAYPSPVTLPAPIARLDDAPGQWVFDRSAALATSAPDAARSLLSVVISTNGPHDALAHAELGTQVDAQLRRLVPALPASGWSYVVAERRATYACLPALPRPSPGLLGAGLYLAGDYTDPEFPPTLEAATRSGVVAAQALCAALRGATRSA